jgi:hypothetical protein
MNDVDDDDYNDNELISIRTRYNEEVPRTEYG